MSNHEGHAIDFWITITSIANLDIAEALALKAAMAHALLYKEKATYIERDAKFIIQSLVKDELHNL